MSTTKSNNNMYVYTRTFVTDDVFLDSVDCSEGRVCREINHMKSNASAGPDGIPPTLLKKIAPSLITPLSLLFSSFLSVGQVPATWKSAIVTPTYKNGLASFRNWTGYHQIHSRIYTVFRKKLHSFYFSNNFVDPGPIWIIFGNDTPEEIVIKPVLYFKPHLFLRPYCTL